MVKYGGLGDTNGDESQAHPLLEVEPDEYQAAFGEPVENSLNIDTWKLGEDLSDIHHRLHEMTEGLKEGQQIREAIRSDIFRRLATFSQVPGAGWYQAKDDQLEKIHRGILFNGGVEACDGMSLIHDTLSLTVAQIGVSLVSYQGDQGTWVQRLYRRDLRMKGFDPVGEVLKVLEQREKRDQGEAQSKRDKLSELSQRGILYYAERAILLHKSAALWRMGHGTPIPYELLTGSGIVIGNDMPILTQSMKVLRALLGQHQKWVFVSDSLSDRVARTLGEALNPLEYAIVGSPVVTMRNIVKGNLPRESGLQGEAIKFVEDLGPQIVTGVFRASLQAPPSVFYAHKDYAHQAAHIALADSVLQEHRGFPVLLDLTKTVCQTTFGMDMFHATLQQAYVDAGMPFRYLPS